MKNLLYVGNHLQNSQSNASYSAVLGPLLEKEGYQVSYTSHKKNKFLRLLDMLLSTLKRCKKIDLVLIDTYSTQNFYYAFLVSQLCRLLKLPYVPILHGGNLPQRLKRSPKLSNRIFKHAHANIAPSLYLKEIFEKFGYHSLVYIPNAIRLENYPMEPKTYDVPRLLWVRSFSEIYNPILAIEVLHVLRTRGFKAELCMIGPDADGSLSKVKALAEAYNLTVTFPGKLTKTEWIEMSKASNVFINTTHFDNAPVSVIEAMALGLPVVSTNVGGMPYLITHEEDGLLVPPNKVNAMANAVVLLMEHDALRANIIENARAKVEGFDWKVVSGMWDVVLEMEVGRRKQEAGRPKTEDCQLKTEG